MFATSGGPVRGDDLFLRGDVNTDGQISISDSLMMRRWLFNGDRAPTCHDSADFDDVGHLDISDQIGILRFAFLGGPAPPAPFPAAGPDPTSDEYACERYVVVQPEETNDVLRIGDVSGSPGENVKIPVILSNSRELEAFQVVLAYDPAVITIPEVLGDAILFADSLAGSYYENGTDPKYGFFFTVQPYPADGMVVAAFIPSFINEGFELPAGDDQIVFHIVGTIAAGAPEGATVNLDPVNTGYGPAVLKNEVTHRGDARFVSLVPQAVGGILHIVGDQTFFVRGDSNDDDKVDLSDAQFTLSFLFLGLAAPGCLDAADANDDNKVDISDPIRTLQVLFLGGTELPMPYPLSGADPTPDGLDC